MKKLILLFALLLCSTISVFAQNYQEVVYLKNGSIIRGVIIEQIPNVSLKIQTPDNSLFVCQMSEVEKITKEVQGERRSNRARCSSLQLNNNSGIASRGYKGFVETGYSLGTGDCSVNRFEISTSHGYQFNPYLFLGAGLGISYYDESNLTAIPVFVDFRTNFIKNKITPIAGIKFGYSSGDLEGFYGCIDLGVRFGMSGKKAMTVKLGYTSQNLEVERYSSFYNPTTTVEAEAVSLKVGFEF